MTELFERRLRSSFVRADLPLAPDRLHQMVINLPASAAPARSRPGRPQWFQLAAALALIAAGAGALAYAVSNLPTQGGPGPSQSPTPTPRASASPSPSGLASHPLPAPAGLLSAYDSAGLSFERSVGPADRPVSGDATVTRIDLGPLGYAHDIVLAGACLGEGELSVTIRYTTLPSVADPFDGLVTPCNGDVVAISYAGTAGDQIEIEVISLSVSAGASWRFAIGEIPDAIAPATFAPIDGTVGWWRLWDVAQDTVNPETGIGVGVRVADAVRRLGMWVECSGADSVELTLVREAPSPGDDFRVQVVCAPGEPQRIEVAVSGGERVSVTVTPDSAIPVHLYVEADAMPVSEWGEPPDLPEALAHVPFMASSGSYVALGQLGASGQVLVPVGGVGPVNRPGGEFAAIPEMSPNGTTLGLYSVLTGERLATLAEHESGTFIATTWVDPLHEQVLYAVGTPSGLDVFRVGIDGSGQTRLATSPASATASLATLAFDNNDFVSVACPTQSCQLAVLDIATLESRQVEFSLDAELCGTAGSTDGVVVMRVADVCVTTGPQEIVVIDIDGNEIRRMPDPGFVVLIRTANGPALLVGDPAGSGLSVVDIGDGSSSQLAVNDATLMPVQGVQLPPDWVLLAPFTGIGDFPVHPSLLLGNAPILVNVISGETIEMVNLPH
ncbi:MAG: hypothetical protein QOJ81_1038 [Chloroflexota bacterium]|nr:hypothetical protein [Chloroflexota bacterium]